MISGIRKRIVAVFLICLTVTVTVMTNRADADDAMVLPKGVSSVTIKGSIWLPTSERFGSDRHAENIAADYNTTLDSSVFPALAAFGPGANIGNSVVSMKISHVDYYLAYMYGVTDKLSAGISVPYLTMNQKIKARLDSSGATVGKNAGFACGAPFCPMSVPGTVALTTEDIQSLLGKGLDVNGDGTVDIPGYGYKRFGDWSGSGLGDTDVGIRYQYLKTEDWRAAFMVGATLPTGKVNNPDDLTDLTFGDGQYDLLLRLNNDYTGIKDLILDGTIKYDIQLPDHQTLRVPDNANQPITSNKENVKRNLGDIFQFEVSGNYTFLKILSASLLYHNSFKLKDSISGDKGFAYQSLEDETNQSQQYIIAGVSFSTLPWFQEKTFSVPLNVSLEYRNKFAGANNVLKSQYVSLALTSFF